MSETLIVDVAMRAKQIMAERPGVNAVAAIRLAQGEAAKAPALPSIGTRCIKWMHGDTPQRQHALGAVWVRYTQVACVVLDSMGREYRLVSGLAEDVPPLRFDADVATAEAWLNFLGDLYEGKLTKDGDA